MKRTLQSIATTLFSNSLFDVQVGVVPLSKISTNRLQLWSERLCGISNKLYYRESGGNLLMSVIIRGVGGVS